MTETTRTLLGILSDFWRSAVMYGVFVLFTLLMMANWSLPYFSTLKPQIVLIAIFYWTLYRPMFMPPWLIFLVGLVLDGVSPVFPVGTHAFSYLLVAGVLRPQRRMLMGQPFMMIWVAFIIAAALDMGVKVLILQILTPQSLNLSTIALNMLVTVLAFPLVLSLLVFVHRILPPARGMIAT